MQDFRIKMDKNNHDNIVELYDIAKRNLLNNQKIVETIESLLKRYESDIPEKTN